MSETTHESVSGSAIIMNGGDPLPGCPENFDEAYKWADEANKDKPDTMFPNWSWDCGFKLDFDGPLVSVSSRFYPPKTHYGPTWDGTVHISVLGKIIVEKKFDCPTLDEIKKAVEAYIDEFTGSLEQSLSSVVETFKGEKLI